MKLSAAVMDVVRGAGGAALIAASALGASACGGGSAQIATEPTIMVTANASSSEAPKLDPVTAVSSGEEPVPYSEESLAVPCGRG